MFWVFPVSLEELSVRARSISEGMKLAAAKAIASCVEDVDSDHIIPSPFNPEVAAQVAKAVAKTALDEGLARLNIDLDQMETTIHNELKI